MTENQVKYKIDDFEDISKKIIELEGIFIGGFYEKTIRYDTIDDKLYNQGIFLRTKSGMKNVLTLKEKINDIKGETLERLTTEIEIDDVLKMQYFLKKIGLIDKFVMEKYRLYFVYDKVEITIDELPFGLYLEIKGDIKEIKKTAKLLGLKNVIKVTYWDIYDKMKDKKSNNIIFDKNHIFKIATY